MRVLVVLLMLTSLALSGCVAPATGLSHRDTAESHASSIQSDAELVGMMGAEWRDPAAASEVTDQSAEAQALIELGTDENPGDGLANAWAYFFRSEASDIVVVVGANGKIIDSQELEPGESGAGNFEFGDAIGDIEIDSNEAATIVMANHTKFPSMLELEDIVVMMFLIADNEQFDGATWAFMGFSESEGGVAFAMVNAQNGTYTDFSNLFGS
jgi:hypothetical protein